MLAPTRECDAGEAESECGKGTQEMALHKRERERDVAFGSPAPGGVVYSMRDAQRQSIKMHLFAAYMC